MQLSKSGDGMEWIEAKFQSGDPSFKQKASPDILLPLLCQVCSPLEVNGLFQAAYKDHAEVLFFNIGLIIYPCLAISQLWQFRLPFWITLNGG